jgi:hypothetical protein
VIRPAVIFFIATIIGDIFLVVVFKTTAPTVPSSADLPGWTDKRPSAYPNVRLYATIV